MRLANVTIRDFQSLENVSLDLDALTVIVGPSNSGKSAVVRALAAALFNQTGGAFVREGATEAQVSLDFAPPEGEFIGSVIRWEKPRKGGARYHVMGNEPVWTEITRVAGRELPPELDAITGVREIECEGGVRARLQFDGQFDEPFLLAGTGGQAARLLARVSKFDALVTAQVRAKRDAERARREADVAGARTEEMEARLASMPDYEALAERWVEIRDRVGEMTARARQIVAWRTHADDLRVHRERVSRWAAAGIPARTAALRAAAEPLTLGLKLWGRLEAFTGALAGATREASEARDSHSHAVVELEQLLEGLSICPVCQRPM